jgi:hypothetical protein
MKEGALTVGQRVVKLTKTQFEHMWHPLSNDGVILQIGQVKNTYRVEFTHPEGQAGTTLIWLDRSRLATLSEAVSLSLAK